MIEGFKSIGVMFKRPSEKGKFVDGCILLIKMEEIITK
jgi:hypothetical protein